MQDAGAVFADQERLGARRLLRARAAVAQGGGGAARLRLGRRRPTPAVLAEESAALRERVGLIDMTSFGKIAVEGPGAAALLERVCDAHVDREPGAVVYTQFLNERGGIVADVTVTRLAEERFRVVTGAAAVDSDLGWLRLHQRDGRRGGRAARRDRRAVRDRDVGAARARRAAGRERGRRRSRRLPVRPRARARRSAAHRVWAQRITYVGELGYEMYADPGWGVQIWDRLAAAGARHGIRPAGYRVLDSLRMEKGYRAFGSDLTAGDTPDEAGLGFCVALERKGDFTGRAAVEAQRARGSRAPPAHAARGRRRPGVRLRRRGGALRAAQVVGRVRSAAYGFTVGRMIANAYLPLCARDRTRR